MTKRIQIRRIEGWKMPPNTVKVDRSTKWGNPFIVGKHGNQSKCVDYYKYLMMGLPVVSMDNFDEQIKSYEYVKKNLDKLRGKNLACWCRKGTPCHADILLKLANKPKD